jgi:hypothetical protein
MVVARVVPARVVVPAPMVVARVVPARVVVASEVVAPVGPRDGKN